MALRAASRAALSVLLALACRARPIDRAGGGPPGVQEAPPVGLETGVAAAERPCLPVGWCWWNFPRGAAIAAIWGSGPADVYAAGTAGALLHFDGTRWSATHLGGAQDLVGVWGAGPSEAYVLARDGLVRRYDGAAWTPVPGTAFPEGRAVSRQLATSGRVAWVAPTSLGVLRFDGERWEDAALGDRIVVAAWAAGPDEVFVAREWRIERHRAGEVTRWELPFAPRTVSGSSPGDVWASAGWATPGWQAPELPPWVDPQVARFDGESWEPVPGVAGPVFVADRGDAWVGANRLDGGEVVREPATPDFLRWAASAQQVWGVRLAAMELALWDGAAWRTTARLGGFARVLGEAGAEDAWGLVAGAGGVEVIRFDGEAWSIVEGSAMPASDVAPPYAGGATYGTSSADFWIAAGPDRLLHWTGAAWSAAPFAVDPGRARLTGTAPDDVWVVDAGGTWHWDGAGWERRGDGVTGVLQGAWARSREEVFAIAIGAEGADGWTRLTDRLWRWDGDRWVEILGGAGESMRVGPTSEQAGGMWGADADEAWATAVGLYRFDGRAWSRVDDSAAPFGERVRGSRYWGAGRDDVWIGSPTSGIAWEWNGRAWTRHLDAPFTGGAGAWAYHESSGALWRRARAAARAVPGAPTR